ncbi:aminotransferase, partial [Penicillium bovifimosum]
SCFDQSRFGFASTSQYIAVLSLKNVLGQGRYVSRGGTVTHGFFRQQPQKHLRKLFSNHDISRCRSSAWRKLVLGAEHDEKQHTKIIPNCPAWPHVNGSCPVVTCQSLSGSEALHRLAVWNVAKSRAGRLQVSPQYRYSSTFHRPKKPTTTLDAGQDGCSIASLALYCESSKYDQETKELDIESYVRH